jgi:hypothetical protein
LAEEVFFMLSISAEIRWWSENPAEFLNWFESVSTEPLPEEEIRVDHYLRHTGHLTSVKWRSGNLEVKVCRSSRKTSFGVKEGFVKESLPTALNQDDLPSEEWISVQKRRILLAWAYGDNKLVRTRERIEEGCELEFSHISIEEREFYGLCIEAQSTQGKEIEILEAAIDQWRVRKAPFREFPSMGYGEFLKKNGGFGKR